MAEDSAFWSWTCLNAALVGFAVFPLGLINGEFEGLLPLVEDLYQEVLCSAAQKCVPELCLYCSRSMVEDSVIQSWTCLNQGLVGLKYFNLGII